VLLDIIEHLDRNDTTKCLKEVRRVLKKNGVVFGHTPNLWSKPVKVVLQLLGSSPSVQHINLQNPRSLKSLFLKSGFNPKLSFGYEAFENTPFRDLIQKFFIFGSIWLEAKKGI
jgi:ubiquinone/menaquinone biosynthesis C-methylase UbiE